MIATSYMFLTVINSTDIYNSTDIDYFTNIDYEIKNCDDNINCHGEVNFFCINGKCIQQCPEAINGNSIKVNNTINIFCPENKLCKKNRFRIFCSDENELTIDILMIMIIIITILTTCTSCVFTIYIVRKKIRKSQFSVN